MDIHVNGIDLWYEKSGQGAPIVLLHGNGETHDIFNVLVPQLAENFTVYALDSRCHGKSGKSDEFNYEMMAEDVAAFIKALGLEKPILYGFSDGGIIGLLLASLHPGLLSKIAVSGANTDPAGVKKSWERLFKLLYFFTRDPKIKLMLTAPHISDEQLGKIALPVLILAGERDLIKEEHTKRLAANIRHSTLKILPKENHMSYVIHSPKLYGLLKDFLGL